VGTTITLGAGVVGAAPPVCAGFGVVAGAVTVWVMAGAACDAAWLPHAARLRLAANAMAGTAMSFLLSFIVLPFPSTERPHFTFCYEKPTNRAYWYLEENS
jgi:hypothetical protein